MVVVCSLWRLGVEHRLPSAGSGAHSPWLSLLCSSGGGNYCKRWSYDERSLQIRPSSPSFRASPSWCSGVARGGAGSASPSCFRGGRWLVGARLRLDSISAMLSFSVSAALLHCSPFWPAVVVRGRGSSMRRPAVAEEVGKLVVPRAIGEDSRWSAFGCRLNMLEDSSSKPRRRRRVRSSTSIGGPLEDSRWRFTPALHQVVSSPMPVWGGVV